jgi:hypothetical protein
VGAAVAAVHAAAARLQHSHGTPQSALTIGDASYRSQQMTALKHRSSFFGIFF